MKLLLLIGVVAFAATSNAIIPVNSVVKSVNTFSNNVVKAIVDDVSKNLVCSPISAHMVLSMAAFGARGNTEKVLRSALGLTGDDAVLKNGFQTLVDSLTQSSNYELRLANKVFLDASIKPTAEFMETTKTAFRSEAQKLNFGNPSAASKVINDWTAVQTNNHIKDIVVSGDLSSDTGLVLVNAIYFKANWENEFEAPFTQPRAFHVNGKSVRNLPTMRSQESYRHGELSDVNAKFIELPYRTEDYADAVSMFIIVPNEINGLSQLVKNLDKVTVQRLQQGEYGYMNVFLPKFKIESTIDLKAPLVELGLGEIFSNAANFAGIVNPSNLKVSQIVQKAYIAVDELGTEATASTKLQLDNKFGSDDSEPEVFRVDRPFVAVIATKNGVPLFSSVVSEPIF